MYQAEFAVPSDHKPFTRQTGTIAALPCRGTDCERAAGAERATEAILATLSHELRSPLHSVLMALELAREVVGDESLTVILDQALAAGRGLNTLLGDILVLASLENGSAQPLTAIFKVEDLCAGVVDIYKVAALEKQISLTTYVEKGLPAAVMGDAVRLRLALAHIVGNALKFTESGMVAIHLGQVYRPGPSTISRPSGNAGVKPAHSTFAPLPPYLLATLPQDLAMEIAAESGIAYRRRSNTHLLRITVTDTGLGIPDTDQAHIWEPFRRGNETLTQTHPGAGLGLALVKRLVEHMKGKVELFSREGLGTTVRVEVEVGRGEV